MRARAEDSLVRKQGRTPIGTAARGAAQTAEDARVLTLRQKEREHLAADQRRIEEEREKAEADARAAQAQSEEDARRRGQAESQANAASAQSEEDTRRPAQPQAHRQAAEKTQAA